MEFLHSWARDLARILLEPGLLSEESFPGLLLTDSECEAIFSSGRDSLMHRDQRETPEQLATPEGKDIPLGRYFEQLLRFWVSDLLLSPRYETGLVIRRGSETLGEMDLVFEWEKQVRHWEASVKFYLCSAHTPSESRDSRFYVGTMTRDRLDLKIARLFERQLKLPNLPETRETLARLGLSLPRSQALVKGMLFYRPDRPELAEAFPPQVSHRHRRGWWLPYPFPEEAPHPPQRHPDSRWSILRKRNWLSPYLAPEEAPLLLTHHTFTSFIEEHFARSQGPLMVAEMRPFSENPAQWREVARGVLVGSEWEIQARLSASLTGSLSSGTRSG